MCVKKKNPQMFGKNRFPEYNKLRNTIPQLVLPLYSKKMSIEYTYFC